MSPVASAGALALAVAGRLAATSASAAPIVLALAGRYVAASPAALALALLGRLVAATSASATPIVLALAGMFAAASAGTLGLALAGRLTALCLYSGSRAGCGRQTCGNICLGSTHRVGLCGDDTVAPAAVLVLALTAHIYFLLLSSFRGGLINSALVELFYDIT